MIEVPMIAIGLALLALVLSVGALLSPPSSPSPPSPPIQSCTVTLKLGAESVEMTGVEADRLAQALASNARTPCPGTVAVERRPLRTSR